MFWGNESMHFQRIYQEIENFDEIHLKFLEISVAIKVELPKAKTFLGKLLTDFFCEDSISISQ